MPIKPIDYSKTIIYKLQHKDKKELFYVGHTTNFDSRKKQHKLACCQVLYHSFGSPFYMKMHSLGGWNSFEMIPIKKVNCKDRIDALIEEQKAIDELGATLNYNPAHKHTAQHGLEVYRKEFSDLKQITRAIRDRE